MCTSAYMWGYSMQHGKKIYILKERKAGHDYKEGKEVAAHRRIYGNFHRKGKGRLGKRYRALG